MRNIVYDGYMGPRLNRKLQLRRLRNVMEHELTPRQRMLVEEVLLRRRTMTDVAKELGVNKSTVCRSFHRALARIRLCLKY